MSKLTDDWGADLVFEASGSARAFEGLFDLVRPGGAVVLIGMPVDPVPFDVVGAQVKEARIETIFRYANVHARAIELIASGKVDLKPLISAHLPVRAKRRGGRARRVRPARRRQAAGQDAAGAGGDLKARRSLKSSLLPASERRFGDGERPFDSPLGPPAVLERPLLFGASI